MSRLVKKYCFFIMILLYFAYSTLFLFIQHSLFCFMGLRGGPFDSLGRTRPMFCLHDQTTPSINLQFHMHLLLNVTYNKTQQYRMNHLIKSKQFFSQLFNTEQFIDFLPFILIFLTPFSVLEMSPPLFLH